MHDSHTFNLVAFLAAVRLPSDTVYCSTAPTLNMKPLVDKLKRLIFTIVFTDAEIGLWCL